MISVDLEKAKQEDEEARGISTQSKENLDKLNNSLQVEEKRQEDFYAIVERYKEQFPDAGCHCLAIALHVHVIFLNVL